LASEEAPIAHDHSQPGGDKKAIKPTSPPHKAN
jgi:hypothetical protein